MKGPRSLQARLALWLGLLLTALWAAAAFTSAAFVARDMEEVFDSALQETAQRLLPLAVADIVSRDEDGLKQRIATIREHVERFTYIVRDDKGRILLQSHAADPAAFPDYDGAGFRRTPTLRLYSEEALQGSVRITVAEPLARRAMVARELQIGLGLPLLVILPAGLLAIVLVVRATTTPLRRFRDRLADRNARDLTPVPPGDLPAEIAPVAATLNDLLARLDAAFKAERSFAANAAHELRTPLAGAIAQIQRLRSETNDEAVSRRAGEIEAALKRLTRTSQRLLELSRAEGARLRVERSYDLTELARMVFADLARLPGGGRLVVKLPGAEVRTDLDPDAFGILTRNLVENALRHGAGETPVNVTLDSEGLLTVANEGPLVPAETLAILARRFERGGAAATGSGLGLSIVAAIVERLGGELTLSSPRPGHASGFEVRLRLPVVATSHAV